MKRRLLMASFMFALACGPVWADDNNTVYIEQLGQSNDITVSQLHDPDIQNTPSTNNIIGSEADPVRQEGSLEQHNEAGAGRTFRRR